MAGTTSYPSRRTLRLQNYDYSQAGAYFVTICTEGRICRFGSIHDGVMVVNPVGRLVGETWTGLEKRFGVGVDAFVVMPNHVHGVLVWPERRARQEPAPTETLAAGEDGLVDLSLSEVVRRFKTYTANRVRRMVAQDHQRADTGLWQRNFYERVIRNDRELNAIREYIIANPLQWHLDRENPDR